MYSFGALLFGLLLIRTSQPHALLYYGARSFRRKPPSWIIIWRGTTAGSPHGKNNPQGFPRQQHQRTRTGPGLAAMTATRRMHCTGRVPVNRCPTQTSAMLPTTHICQFRLRSACCNSRLQQASRQSLVPREPPTTALPTDPLSDDRPCLVPCLHSLSHDSPPVWCPILSPCPRTVACRSLCHACMSLRAFALHASVDVLLVMDVTTPVPPRVCRVVPFIGNKDQGERDAG